MKINRILLCLLAIALAILGGLHLGSTEKTKTSTPATSMLEPSSFTQITGNVSASFVLDTTGPDKEEK